MFDEESGKVLQEDENEHVIDARYQSFSRVYIHDIHAAEIIDGVDDQVTVSKKGIIKIKMGIIKERMGENKL